MSLFEELKRRNVFRVAIAYIVTAWLLLQVADVVLGNIEAPPWVFKTILLLVGLGFPLAIVIAWAFELTPDGLKKEREVRPDESITRVTGRKLDYVIIGVLAVGLLYFAVDKYGGSPSAPAAPATATANAPGDGLQSIAVLPFVNMSSDPEQEYFSDGISEEILNVLAQYDDLRVAARTSSFQFKGQNQDIGEIARLLNVGHVLEGSVRKAGNKLRITAQLIKADDGFHLWSETYDRELDDVFAIQDEIANAISDALTIKLALGSEASRPAVVAAANTQAYDAFLKGRALIHQRGRANLDRAVEELEKSIRLDASFAPAHANLAIAYALLLDSPSTYGDMTLAESQAQAVPHAERALELQPNLAEGHAAKALLALNRSEPRMTIEHAGRALEINPSYGDVYTWMAIAYGNIANFEEADKIAAQVLEVDPMSVIGRINVANRMVMRYRLDEAREQARILEKVNPWAAYRSYARIENASGNTAESIRWALRAYRENPSDALSNRDLVFALMDIQLYDEARRISDRYEHWIDFAEGDIDGAIATVERRHELDPDNIESLDDAAYTFYFARRYKEALELFEEWLARSDETGSSLNAGTYLAIADLRRRAGDEFGAEALEERAEEWIAQARKTGVDFGYKYIGQAFFHAYFGNHDEALDSLAFAVDERGIREKDIFEHPLFAELQDNPRWSQLMVRLDRILAAERELALQIMCHDNPVPDAWQPLPQTCQGVPRQTAT